jgi:hypothetical protein
LIGGTTVAKKKVLQEVEVDEPDMEPKTKEQLAFIHVFGEQTDAHKSSYVTVKQLEELVNVLANGLPNEEAPSE